MLGYQPDGVGQKQMNRTGSASQQTLLTGQLMVIDSFLRTTTQSKCLSPVSSICDFPDLVDATTAAVACVTPRDAC